MISVVVTPPGHSLRRALYRTLSRRFEVLCVAEHEILLPELAAPDILLVEAAVPLECEGDVVYVMGTPPAQEPPFTAGERAVAVIHSQNDGALSFAARHHLKTLTYGLSGHDTLTLSSLTDDSAVLCVQREVATLGGGTLEPGEVPVRLRAPVERGELLAVAAVLLLCGDGDLEDSGRCL